MSTPSQAVAERRVAGQHTSMFLRMLMRAAVLRRGRAASALLAMVVAAAVATAMMNLYVDVQGAFHCFFSMTFAMWSSFNIIPMSATFVPAQRNTKHRIMELPPASPTTVLSSALLLGLHSPYHSCPLHQLR